FCRLAGTRSLLFAMDEGSPGAFSAAQSVPLLRGLLCVYRHYFPQFVHFHVAGQRGFLFVVCTFRSAANLDRSAMEQRCGPVADSCDGTTRRRRRLRLPVSSTSRRTGPRRPSRPASDSAAPLLHSCVSLQSSVPEHD